MTAEEIPTLEDLGIAQPSGDEPLRQGYRTDYGVMYAAKIEELLESDAGRELEGEVQLIFTSPPFPLNRKKRYGNKTGKVYRKWLRGLAPRLRRLLKPDGSIVIELGNAWVPGKPIMSTLTMEALWTFLRAGNLNLCQQFVCHNPARLPSPAQWVNIERIRVKDSFTHVWWMAPSERPKADNSQVLREYGPDMKKLLRTHKYNAGRRPSGHNIGETSFFTDNGGAIPPNVLEISNTSSTDPYRQFCREYDLEVHPAPMQPELADFFINMLTEKGDLVLDPFGGSNTTGAVAEELGRRWVATEPECKYLQGSMGRFPQFRDEGPDRPDCS